jgi:hypothetical protein
VLHYDRRGRGGSGIDGFAPEREIEVRRRHRARAVLDGDASPAWARTAVASLAEALPNARRRTLAGQDHGPAPQALALVLAEFFAA